MQGQKGRCESSVRKEKSVSTLLMGPPVCCMSGCILALEELVLRANAALQSYSWLSASARRKTESSPLLVKSRPVGLIIIILSTYEFCEGG